MEELTSLWTLHRFWMNQRMKRIGTGEQNPVQQEEVSSQWMAFLAFLAFGILAFGVRGRRGHADPDAYGSLI